MLIPNPSFFFIFYFFAEAPVQVAFGVGGASPSLRYGVPRAGNINDGNQGSASKSMFPLWHSFSN